MTSLPLSTETKAHLMKELLEMHLFCIMKRGDNEEAVHEINTSDIPEERKLTFYEMIALGSHPSETELRARHQ